MTVRTPTHRTDRYPDGTVATVEPGQWTGFGARVVRPDGTWVATHLDAFAACERWVEGELA